MGTPDFVRQLSVGGRGQRRSSVPPTLRWSRRTRHRRCPWTGRWHTSSRVNGQEGGRKVEAGGWGGQQEGNPMHRSGQTGKRSVRSGEKRLKCWGSGPGRVLTSTKACSASSSCGPWCLWEGSRSLRGQSSGEKRSGLSQRTSAVQSSTKVSSCCQKKENIAPQTHIKKTKKNHNGLFFVDIL